MYLLAIKWLNVNLRRSIYRTYYIPKIYKITSVLFLISFIIKKDI